MMKKLLVLFLICCCVSPTWAQRGFGRRGPRANKPSVAHTTKKKSPRKKSRFTPQARVKHDEISRLVTQQTNRATQQLKNYKLVPLQITSATVPTALAVPQTLLQPQKAVGTLLRSTYMQYREADHALDIHFAQLNQPENAAFLYRGMHITDLKTIEDIWTKGLPIGKTGYNSIYMTSNHAVARHYAKLEDGIPVVVMMRKDAIAGSLRPGNMTNFYAEKDVPASAISDVFMLLDINGRPAWYRALWQNKLVFVPLKEEVPATPTQHIKITNLPGEPLVKLGGTVDDAPTVLSARMLAGADSWHFIRPTDAIGRYTEQTFLPKDILENKESFYRGMRLGKLDDIKNLLINGLEVNKSNYSGEIYASLQISIPLYYATMGSENLPVLIQIPATETLRSYAPEAFPTEDRYAAKAFQTGEVCIFRRDIPAHFISNVWVFLEVNGKPDWYKVTLENDELVFVPAWGEMTTGGKAALTDPVPVSQVVTQKPYLAPIHWTNFSNKVPMKVFLPEHFITETNDNNLLSASLLKPSQVYQGVANYTQAKLYLPFSVNAEENFLYRGMRLFKIQALKNILVNGLQVGKTQYRAVYTAKRPEIALWYMGLENANKPIDMDQLFEESDLNKYISALVRIAVTPQLLRTNPPDNYRDEIFFYKTIPSNKLEVFVFVEIAGQPGWYRVTLGSNQELVFTWVESRETPGRIDWE